MNLLELMAFYQMLLIEKGKEEADKMLADMGIDAIMQVDIQMCFDLNGKALHNQYALNLIFE